MDITSVTSNASILNTKTELQRETNKTESFQAALEKAAAEKNDVELKKACIEFETYFIQLVFKEMRKTVNTDNSFIKKNEAESIFQEMLDEEYSKDSAKAGGIGLADMMYKQMSQNYASSNFVKEV